MSPSKPKIPFYGIHQTQNAHNSSLLLNNKEGNPKDMSFRPRLKTSSTQRPLLQGPVRLNSIKPPSITARCCHGDSSKIPSGDRQGPLFNQRQHLYWCARCLLDHLTRFWCPSFNQAKRRRRSSRERRGAGLRGRGSRTSEDDLLRHGRLFLGRVHREDFFMKVCQLRSTAINNFVYPILLNIKVNCPMFFWLWYAVALA